MENFKYSGLLMVGASCLVLSSCLPEDEILLNDRNLQNIESQIQLYARSFQQYQNRSLSNLVNSGNLLNPTFSEGLLPDTGDMGNAEAFLASAYCTDGADKRYHITWFEGENGSGQVSLKGLGSGLIGQANQKIKSIMPDAQFGIYDGTNVMMAESGALTLSSACQSLNIPTNSAIAAVSLPDQNMSLAMDTKTVLRTRACANANETGGIIESAEIAFRLNDTEENYNVNGADYTTEAAAINAVSSGDWEMISNDCVTALNSTVLAGAVATEDMINTAALMNANGEAMGDVAEGLEGSLTDINCVHVGKGVPDANDVDGDGDTEEYIFPDIDNQIYETCITESDLDLTDRSSVELVDDFNTVLSDSFICPAGTQNYPGNGAIVVEGDSGGNVSPFFTNVDNRLIGISGTISTGGETGQLDVEKTIRTFITLVDLGNGLPEYTDGDISSAKSYMEGVYASDQSLVGDSMVEFERLICNDQDGCNVKNNTKMVGTGGMCEADQTLTFSCAQMYPDLTAYTAIPSSDTASDTNVTSNSNELSPYATESLIQYFDNRYNGNAIGQFYMNLGIPIANSEANVADSRRWRSTGGNSSISGQCRNHNGNSCASGPQPPIAPADQLFSTYDIYVISRGNILINDDIATWSSSSTRSTENSAGDEHFVYTRTTRHDFELVDVASDTDNTPPISSDDDNGSDGLIYMRSAVLHGWHDEEMLVPNDYEGGWVQQAPMECNFQETRTVNVGCPSGHTGSNTRTERRTWTATAPEQTPSWGNWEEVSTTGSCVSSSSNGGSHGHVVNTNRTSLTVAR